jgi:hypothetical protein
MATKEPTIQEASAHRRKFLLYLLYTAYSTKTNYHNED